MKFVDRHNYWFQVLIYLQFTCSQVLNTTGLQLKDKHCPTHQNNSLLITPSFNYNDITFLFTLLSVFYF